MALEKQDIHGLQREQLNECRSFFFGVIKDRRRWQILAFFKQRLVNSPSKVCVLLWLFRAFYFLSFSSYLYKVRVRHSQKPVRRSYLQLKLN